MSTILEALGQSGVRMSCGYRWLVMDRGMFEVYERRPYQHNTILLYQGNDESLAVLHLLSDES